MVLFFPVLISDWVSLTEFTQSMHDMTQLDEFLKSSDTL